MAVDDPSNTVTVYLAHAPKALLDRLRATHPGLYVILNAAPRPLRAVMRIMRSLSFARLRAEGIEVTGYGPTVDGHLRVGVSNHVAAAQARLDRIYGRDVIRVVEQGVAVAFRAGSAPDGG